MGVYWGLYPLDWGCLVRVLIFGLLVVLTSAAQAVPFTITHLGFLPGGNDETSADDINNNAQIVGLTQEAGGYIWESGSITPAGISSAATGINSSGVIVGDSTQGAVVIENGVTTLLGFSSYSF